MRTLLRTLEVEYYAQQQMEQILSRAADASTIVKDILSKLKPIHRVLISCTIIFNVYSAPLDHAMFGEWTEEEKEAFSFKFSNYQNGRWTIEGILREWYKLVQVSLKSVFL